MIIKQLREIPMGSPFSGALNTAVVYKFRDFRLISRYIWQTIPDCAIVTIEGEYETAPKLSNGTSLNDLE